MGVNDAKRPDEAIAFADDSFEEDRLFGIVGKCGADFADDVIYISLGIHMKIGAPEFCDDVLTRDELVAAADEKDEKLHGLFLEPDAKAGAAQLIAAEVEFELRSEGFCARHERATFWNDAIFISNLRRYIKNTERVCDVD